MRCARLIFAALLVLALAGTAHANAIDAGVIIKQGNQSNTIGPQFTLVSSTGTGAFVLLNDAPGTVPFSSLLLIFNVASPLPTGTPLGCSVLAFFQTCQFLNPLGPINTLGVPLSLANQVILTSPFSGPLLVLFSGGNGIPVVGDFDIVINDWGSATTIQGIANPEPATMTLMLLGAGAAFLRRKRLTV